MIASKENLRNAGRIDQLNAESDKKRDWDLQEKVTGMIWYYSETYEKMISVGWY